MMNNERSLLLVDNLIDGNPFFLETDDNGAGYNPNRDKSTGRFTFGSIADQTLLRSHFKDNGARTFGSEDDIAEYVNEYHNGHPGSDAMDAAGAWVDASGCRAIQESIRTGENYEKIISTLDTLTNSNTLKSDVNLYRGMGTTKAQLQTMAQQGSFKTKTFFTTGLNAERVETHFSGYTAGYDTDLSDFRKPTLFRIKAKAGTKGYFLDSRLPGAGFHNGLGEFLPSRESTYLVKDMRFAQDGSGEFSGAIVDLEIQ